MKGKWSKCFLLIGTIIILMITSVGSWSFVKSNIEKADSKYSFESLYANTKIDFIIPSPSYEQMAALDNAIDVGIEVVSPYYETNTKVRINGVSCNGIAVILPDKNKVENTPYASARILEGSVAGSGQAMIDLAYLKKNECNIGEIAEITLADRIMKFEIVGITEENTYSKNGSIALILTEDDRKALVEAGITYSAAYIRASDIDKCKKFLYSEYKPYGRLKDPSEFTSEDAYQQHVKNFEAADWTKEITNCADNYDALKVKYSNIESAILRNLITYVIIIVIVLFVMNVAFLKSADVQKAMKIFIVKKSGTIADAKRFYSSGIWFNFIEFLILSGVLYYIVASKSIIGVFGTQLINLIIPVASAFVISIILVVISGIYAANKFNIKKSE